MIKKKILVIGMIITAIVILSYAIWLNQRPVVLEFAMFNGSNWNVEIQDSYSVIDRAIDRFEKENPGVKVHYVSGIPKE